MFGNNCNVPCPGNCKTNTCQIQDGSCFDCKPGWTGATCNTGIHKIYNNWLLMRLTKHWKHLINIFTNLQSKHVQLWFFFLLNSLFDCFFKTECAFGLYGVDCSQKCSGHCKIMLLVIILLVFVTRDVPLDGMDHIVIKVMMFVTFN